MIVSELVNRGLVDTEAQAKAIVLYVVEGTQTFRDLYLDIVARYPRLTPEQRDDVFRVYVSEAADRAGIRLSGEDGRHGIDPDCLVPLIAYGVLGLIVVGVAVLLWRLFS